MAGLAGVQIETTPDMVEAGVGVALSHESEDRSKNIIEIAPEIYRAMAAVRIAIERKEA